MTSRKHYHPATSSNRTSQKQFSGSVYSFPSNSLPKLKTNHDSRNHNTLFKEDLLDKLVRLFEQDRHIGRRRLIRIQASRRPCIEEFQNLDPGKSDSIVRPEVKIIEDQLGLETPVVLTGEAGSAKTGISRILIRQREWAKKTLLLDARRVEHI